MSEILSIILNIDIDINTREFTSNVNMGKTSLQIDGCIFFVKLQAYPAIFFLKKLLSFTEAFLGIFLRQTL